MNVIYQILNVLIGLGVLLYGIRQLNIGITASLGVTFKSMLAKSTKNPITAYALGAGVTTVAQSSLMTTNLVAGFVSIGTFGLISGMQLVLGINLGSALAMLPLLLESISIAQYFALLSLVGVLIMMLCKSNTCNNVANALIGFGLLFLGLHLMTGGINALITIPSVFAVIESLSHPIVIVLIGFAISFLSNSTYSTIVIMATLAGISGPLDVNIALYGIYGAAAGLGFSTVVYSIGGASTDGKRLLWFHCLYRTLTGIVFGLIALTGWTSYIYALLGNNAIVTMVIVNLLMLAIPGILILPFSKLFAKIFVKLIKPKSNEDNFYNKFVLDDNAIKTFALGYTTIINSLMEIIKAEDELIKLLLYRLKTKESIRGLRGQIKLLHKVTKMTGNNIIRLSNNKSSEEMAKCKILLENMTDCEHLLERCQKLYDMGTDYRKQSNNMSIEQINSIEVLGEKLHQLAEDIVQLLDAHLQGAVELQSNMLKTAFELSQTNVTDNYKAKRNIFTYCMEMKEYKESNTFFAVLMTMDNINADMVNLAVKIAILLGE